MFSSFRIYVDKGLVKQLDQALKMGEGTNMESTNKDGNIAEENKIAGMARSKLGMRFDMSLEKALSASQSKRDPQLLSTRLNKIVQVFHKLNASSTTCRTWHYRQVLEQLKGDADFSAMKKQTISNLFMHLVHNEVLISNKNGLYTLNKLGYVSEASDRRRIFPIFLASSELEKLLAHFEDKKQASQYVHELVISAINSLQ